MANVNQVGLSAEEIAEFITPTSKYKRQAWLAMAGLLGFLLFYFCLALWFAVSGIRLLLEAYPQGLGGLFQWIVGFSAVFLAAFMLKALFFVKKGGLANDIEITEADEPKLFSFLHEIADEANAPRPHRVFLSNDVNAAVFYDLSVKNLILPSRKNLVIGLALVNILNRTELKAVLAHEFGHFAQRSMSVGIWVYMAQQIAAHMIAQRGKFDSFLRFISRVDLRAAWIGWLLTLVVWSIRAITETAFDWVLRAQRALSREMEFHADLVAVSQTGSDALVHALYRLRSADDAWIKTQQFNVFELQHGRLTRDLFDVHSTLMDTLANILNDPDYNSLPEGAKNPTASFRLFTPELAQPPQMWATHPPNHEREENAKQKYIASPIDDRSAWEIFADADARKIAGSALLQPDASEALQPASKEETDQSLEELYAKPSYDTAYRGIYLNRSAVRHAPSAAALLDSSASTDLENLYPENLVDEMEKLRVLQQECSMLESLRDGVYAAPGGVIRYRGDELVPHELPHVIESLREELESNKRALNEHDRRCRATHRSLAEKARGGWVEHHAGLTSILHYADHTEANLADAFAVLNNVYQIITVDRHVSGRERSRLLKAAKQLHAQIVAVYENVPEVSLGAVIEKEWGVNSWQEVIGELGLPVPTKKNLHEWIQAVDGWTMGTLHQLQRLGSTALEQLLIAEKQLSDSARSGEKLPLAPNPAAAPGEYTTLIPGNERQLQRKLGIWDRFKTADGLVPGLLRLLVSVSIVGGALFLTIYA